MACHTVKTETFAILYTNFSVLQMIELKIFICLIPQGTNKINKHFLENKKNMQFIFVNQEMKDDGN